MNGQFLASVILIFLGLCFIAVSAMLLTKDKKKPGYGFLTLGVLLACASIILILAIDTGHA
ncbi:hypothetical protein COLU111180_09265 [Cohnella lubricantis]|uniref:Uncharacterized protein n=1 Tax=Cohnella lubricantis TaxID=2163172 RepID=A0A841TA59_9BACL|nr:hypothetical protein [Cohnella lubricantis]MBB6676946.1 hypothetical protein [Cohnella lubricantis]MBP2118351.1 hypothetical protein [Cohnella lubricantis]